MEPYLAVASDRVGTLQDMLTHDDLASLDGQTIRKAEIRDGALRLRLASGFIVAIAVEGQGTLSVSDESAIG